MIDTGCPHCRTPYRLKPELAGRQVKCRVCQQAFTVVDPDIADEDLHSIEMPAARTQTRSIQEELPSTREFSSVSGQKPTEMFRPPAKPAKKRPSVDELGFFVDYDDEDDPTVRKRKPETDDPHDEAAILREAARKGAESLNEPRNPKPRSRSARASATGPNAASILIRLGLGITGIVAAAGLVYFGVSMISRAGIRAALAGLPSEIQAEFEQEGDTAIGSPAPPEAKIDSSLPVRDLSKHRALLKDLVGDFNAMADAIAMINDAPSAQAQSPRIDEISRRLQQLQTRIRTENIFDPNPKEDQILAKEFGKSLRTAGERIRDQLRRIQSISSFPLAMSGAMSQVNMGLSQMERQFISKGELPSHEKYAEIRVAGLKNKEEREYVQELITELATPRASRSKTSSLAATRYAIWPVESLSQLAKSIGFGKVIRTTDKEIWVVASPIDPVVLKERLAKRDAEAAERKKLFDESQARHKEAMEEAKKANKDVEIPEDADYVTRALLLATKSKSVFRQRDGLNMLKAASAEDLQGREAEILEALKIPLVEANPFELRDILAVIRRLDTPKRLETLLNRLQIDQHRDEVLQAIYDLKDPQAIEPLASFMSQDRWGGVDKFLISFGVAAEKAVIAQLASPNDDVRKRACEILAVIGTDESLKAMKKLPPDRSFFVRNAAADAMRSIQNRQKLGVSPGPGLQGDESSRPPPIRIEPKKKGAPLPNSTTPSVPVRTRPV